MAEPITHAALVVLAGRWLRKSKRCGVVLLEHSALFEHPDAIGWRYNARESYVVECKVSRADFFADRRKQGRTHGRRPARFCFYLTPPGLVRADELPRGWGLLVAGPKKIQCVVAAGAEQIDQLGAGAVPDDRTPAELREELARLYCEVRRYQCHGLTYPKVDQAVARG